MHQSLTDQVRSYAEAASADEATADRLLAAFELMTDGGMPCHAEVLRTLARVHRVNAIKARAQGMALIALHADGIS